MKTKFKYSRAPHQNDQHQTPFTMKKMCPLIFCCYVHLFIEASDVPSYQISLATLIQINSIMNSSQWQTFRWNKAGHRYKSSGSSRTRQIVICQKPFQLKRSQFKDWHLLNGMLDNFNLISPFSQSTAALISMF